MGSSSILLPIIKLGTMKKIFFLSLLIFNAYLLVSQQYGHILFTIPEQNLLPNSFYQLEDRFIVPTIYPDTISSVISFDSEGEERIDFLYENNFKFASYPYTRIGDQLFFYAKDRRIENDLRIRKQNLGFEMIWEKKYQVSEDYSFPVTLLSIDDYLYTTAINQRTEPYQRVINLKKIDTLGNVIWSKNYGDNLQRSLAYQAKVTMDKNILISAKRDVYDVNVPAHSQLLKVDTAGNIIWHAIGMEQFPNGATRTSVAELSNGQIVQGYDVDKWGMPDWIAAGWNESPFRIDWYDADGNFLFYKYLLSPITEEVGSVNLINGQGDYFFAIGNTRNVETQEEHGFILKMNHQGDTIWTKKYQHPGYTEAGNWNKFRDMIELENGDLMLIGTAAKLVVGEDIPVWVMRVNEHGCLGGTECGDIVITSTNELEKTLVNAIKIYPNPLQDRLTLEFSTADFSFTEIHIFNTLGTSVYRQTNASNIREIDTSQLSPGIYFMLLKDKSGVRYTQRLTKQ